MKKVSASGEGIMAQLICWEMLGGDGDPKALLRSASLADLTIANTNSDGEGHLGQFVCVQLIALEVMYRTGKLPGDWDYRRDGDVVTLIIPTLDVPTEMSMGAVLC